MCQLHEEKRTRRLSARLKKNKKVVGYKVLVTDASIEAFHSPYYDKFKWNIGWNKAIAGSSKFVRKQLMDRARYAGYQKNTYKSIKYKNVHNHTGIYQGIHVFTNKKDAIDVKNGWTKWSGENKRIYEYLVVPVTCYENDFISAGTSDMSPSDLHTAVFAKVYLKKRDYETALKAKNSA